VTINAYGAHTVNIYALNTDVSGADVTGQTTATSLPAISAFVVSPNGSKPTGVGVSK
jgi:DNA-binding transcriptional MocR family regulator